LLVDWSRFLTRRRLAVLAALGLPLLAVILFTFQPNEASYYPRCLFYKATGWQCAGCGTARCIHALLHGRVLQAAAYNLFILIALPFLVYWAVRHTWAGLRDLPTPRRRLPPGATPVLFVLVLSFWVLRNVPSYPFTLLAPHEIEVSSGTEQQREGADGERAAEAADDPPSGARSGR